MTGVPCRTCPFRVEQHADEIPGFDLDLAEDLVGTTTGEIGAPIMACHQSKFGREVACVGWLWRHGHDSIAIRLQLAIGWRNPADLEPDPTIDLHASYAEVLEKLRADSC